MKKELNEVLELMKEYNFMFHNHECVEKLLNECKDFDIDRIMSNININVDALMENNNPTVHQANKELLYILLYILRKKLVEQKKKERKDAFTGVTYLGALRVAFPDMDLRLVGHDYYTVASTYKNHELVICPNNERLYLDCILNYRKAVDLMEEKADEYNVIEEFGVNYQRHSVKHYMQELKINDGIGTVAKLI